MLKKIISTVVYANIWVAFAVVSLCAFTFASLKIYDRQFLFFVFFATLLMYAYARWFEGPAREDEPVSKISEWTIKNRAIYLLSGASGILGTLWFGQYLNLKMWPWLLGCALISAMYPLQFIKGGGALRNIAGLKLFIISVVWATVTTILPSAQVGEPIDFEIILLWMQRVLFIMAITIPFDIRDIRIDSPTINTLPYKLGVKTSRNVALFSLFLAEIGALIFYFSNFYGLGILVGQFVAFEIASLFIYQSSPNKPDLFFSFGVEAISIILFLAVYIFNYFWP